MNHLNFLRHRSISEVKRNIVMKEEYMNEARNPVRDMKI